MSKEGTIIAIKAKGHVLAQTRVRYWVSDGDKLTNAYDINFPQAQYDWPRPDEIVCQNDEGFIFSKSVLTEEYRVVEGDYPVIRPGDYEITLLLGDDDD
jgi:hypothetical protein